MEKFYSVVGEGGKPIYQYHCVEHDKALRVAKKATVDSRSPVFIMTSTELVESPMPEATVTELK